MKKEALILKGMSTGKGAMHARNGENDKFSRPKKWPKFRSFAYLGQVGQITYEQPALEIGGRRVIVYH